MASRVFRAPRSLVFEAWTRAEHFTRWFGPHGTGLEWTRLAGQVLDRLGEHLDIVD